MSRKPFALPEDDPVLEQFRSGLEAWEHPFEGKQRVRARGREVTRGGARARGVVKTRGAVRTRGGVTLPPFTLPEDDPVLRQFREGLERWEHPFRK